MTVYVFSPAARNHVNRLCLAAGVVLIESGSAGYLGQVSVIRKVYTSTVIHTLYNVVNKILSIGKGVQTS